MSQKQIDSSQRASTSRSKAQLLEDLSESRIITKNLVYVIGLSSSIANKEKLVKHEYFGQYGTIIKIVVNKNRAYNQNSPYGPSYSAYVTFSKPSEASIAILSLDETMVDSHLIRASFGTTKYCSFFLKNIECTNKDCLFLHKIADENDIIKRGDLNSNRTIFAQQHSYAIAIADVYNPEVKKKLLSSKKGKTVFPSPDLIYRSIFVIENDPNYHKSHSLNNKSQKPKPVDDKSKKKLNNNMMVRKEMIEKENGNYISDDENGNEGEMEEVKAKKNINLERKTGHKLYLSRDKSRFDFSKKNSQPNEQIDVPLHIQTLINKKINLYKLTKYMHHQIIDQVLQNESLTNNSNTNNTNGSKDEWTQFINDNTINHKDNKTNDTQNIKIDEYIKDFDKINSFIINKCTIKN